MESKGYDMTYVTSADLETNQSLLSGHRVFVNTGHDEYYSDGMRTTITNGVAAGVDLALFSANNFYFRITWARRRRGEREPPHPRGQERAAGLDHLRVAAALASAAAPGERDRRRHAPGRGERSARTSSPTRTAGSTPTRA